MALSTVLANEEAGGRRRTDDFRADIMSFF